MDIRHKCFLSYHHDDQAWVDDFVEEFDQERNVFIARGVGIMEQDIIDSDDPDYVMRRIRERYLADSTVTIVLIGRCTWARKYVDWEIASTLRNDPKNKRSGLLAITLPYVAESQKVLPPRLKDNWDREGNGKGYAKWMKYPSTADSLAAWIDDAWQGRDTRAHLINNARPLFKRNHDCD